MTGTMSFPLVLTKLLVPALRQRVILRARLQGLISAEKHPGLILLSAPAGYGKTTLLSSWAKSAQSTGTAVAWYALDSWDNDPLTFGSYLIASLIQALGPISELTQITQRLRSTPEMDLIQVLPVVINAVLAANRECALVLDDYHLITSKAIHNAMVYLLDHLPENLRILIGSRIDPPFPLARLRARSQLFEIRTADLRFQLDESAQFLNDRMQLDLSPQAVTALEERTEGWVAGLQLAALMLSGRSDKEKIISDKDFVTSFTEGHRYLVEYLLEEVVNRLPERHQRFLLATSILERMSAPLCEAVTCTTNISGDAQDNISPDSAILEQLEQANLFIIALDDQGYWYRYHHLFREFLFAQLKKAMPESIPQLHRSACKWLAANNFLREAAKHAFLTRDWEYAAAFVEQHSFTMIVHSDVATIYEWCSAFPENVMQKHPLLCMHQCWALALSFRKQYKERVEARLHQAEEAFLTLEDSPRVSELKEIAAIIRIFLAMAPDRLADPHEQLKISLDMINTYPDGDPGQFSGLLTAGYAYLALHDAKNAGSALEKAGLCARSGQLFFGIVESTFNLASLTYSQGRLNRSIEICRQAQVELTALLPEPMQALPAIGCLDVLIGCILLEQNHLGDAESSLLRGLDLIGWGTNPYYLQMACIALYRLRVIQNRPAEALQFLLRLETSWPDVAFLTRGLRILRAVQNRPDDYQARVESAAWCNEFLPAKYPFMPGMGPFGAAEVFYQAFLIWLNLKIAAGELGDAGDQIRPMLKLAEDNNLATRVLELSLREVELYLKAGPTAENRAKAESALDRALTLASREGFIRIFDREPLLTRFLVKTCPSSPNREYIERILAAIAADEKIPTSQLSKMLPVDADSPPPSSRLLFAEPLSARELDVLRLLERGATNQEIAAHLVITVGTVKSHINHILRKLDTPNRTAAVAQARELGFLKS
ncbi:MAG: LuxR C-terminal-related transcriptional regulator [Bellilinea sp.]